MNSWTVSPFLPMFIACVWIGFLIVRALWRRRLARKRLVAAALSVINDWRKWKNDPMPVERYQGRVQTAMFMNELIEATKFVN